MKNQNTILAERNKVTNGYRNYMYKFNFNNPNHTEVLTFFHIQLIRLQFA